MEGKLYSLKETIELIEQGRLLVVAADDELLKQLPHGKWIGGFNPFMIDKNGGKFTTEHILVKDFTDDAVNFKFKTYDETDIKNITTDAYDNGVIVAILPVFSKIHYEFALNALSYDNQYVNPLIGWISGGAPETTAPGDATAYVGDQRYTDKGAVLHLELPKDKIARIEIINPVEAAPDSDELTFGQDGFGNTKVFINGNEQDLYAYFESINYPPTYPIMADYAGAKINVGFFKDEENRKMHFFAPVYKRIVYRTIKKLPENYEEEFKKALGDDKDKEIDYSVSCIYNYFNFSLEGKSVANTCANFTWGEIAYHLLNMTHVYLVIEDA